MTREQIEQAAKEYADDTLGVGNSGHYLYDPIKDGFIAGAESRQAEIDELAAAPELLEALEGMIEMWQVVAKTIPVLTNEPIYLAAQKTIEKTKAAIERERGKIDEIRKIAE